MTLVCIGRSTLDLGYICPRFPAEDSKLSSERFTMSGGGPALNAAITARALGTPARLVSRIGEGPLAGFVRHELDFYGVELADLAAGQDGVLPISSIIVVPARGTRTVIDQHPGGELREVRADRLLAGARMVLCDGHLPEVALPVLRHARERGIPTVLDGGSWRPHSPEIIGLVDHAIVSANFVPNAAAEEGDRLAALHRLGARHAAITRGARPIAWSSGARSGEFDPPQVTAVDTLGAGDIFHGAFCHYLLDGADFLAALEAAARIAALSCEQYGTRAWIVALDPQSQG